MRRRISLLVKVGPRFGGAIKTNMGGILHMAKIGYGCSNTKRSRKYLISNDLKNNET